MDEPKLVRTPGEGCLHVLSRYLPMHEDGIMHYALGENRALLPEIVQSKPHDSRFSMCHGVPELISTSDSVTIAVPSPGL